MRISIHAPPRGATNRPVSLLVVVDISIHAPPRGATDSRRVLADRRRISIHAPPRGATKRASQETVFGILFQFTPLREGRRSTQAP